MEEMVVPALAQEGVSRVSSYISTKLEDKASRAYNLARLEMALSQMEFAFERTAKMPITHVSLLRRLKVLKSAYAEGTALLNKHKKQGQEEAGQVVTGYPFLKSIFRARNLPISTLLGFNKDHLSSTVVQTFEFYADRAEKFVSDVETGCTLRRDTFRYPFVTQLLEKKDLWYGSSKGSQRTDFHMVPQHFGDRGVEVELLYYHRDLRRPKNNFSIWLILRLSESTDIIGIAIKCLQLLTSQFKFDIESAVGELTLLPGLQDISHSYVSPYSSAMGTEFWRPDPTCCYESGPRALSSNIVSQLSSSNGVPEPVIAIYFSCWVSAPECKLRNRDAPPLFVVGAFLPHISCVPHPQIIMKYGGEKVCKKGSMQEMGEIRSSALDYLVHAPEPTESAMFSLISAHGAACITLRKSSGEKACPKPRAAPGRGRSGAKRKRKFGGACQIKLEVIGCLLVRLRVMLLFQSTLA